VIRTAALCLILPSAALAQTLGLPIDCVLGDTCYIQQYVDHDSTAATSDFTCGTLSYDGHDGTDFALPTLADQAAGVDVLAVAPGTIAGARDGEPDILQGTPGAPDVTDRECGNGVLIDHTDGLQTQYCHMAQGSIRVRTGDTVVTGTVLGQVGLSGQTQFPHVHLTVRQDGVEVDPFDPDGLVACGLPSDASLFADPVRRINN
jgi:murein DD-endopeptidase MepM/ murein hydrolase activator NlpD